MEFSLAYIKSEQKFLLKNFTPNQTSKAKLIDLEELKNIDLQGIIVDESLKDKTELGPFLQSEQKFSPIRSSLDLNANIGEFNFDEFDLLSFENGKQIFDKMYSSWILQNNLSMLENIFSTMNHLLNLWPNDRTAFFEELWFLLKNNLGAKDLTLIYNDIEQSDQPSKNENPVEKATKGKLIQVKVSGDKIPNPVVGGEFEGKMMERYGSPSEDYLQIQEFNMQKGELVLCATIRKSPVVIMARIYQFTPLQKSLLSALFDGLQMNHVAYLQ